MRKSIDAMGSSSYHSPAHCFDESPAGYSWVGCSPAEPTCASPAESIMPNRRSIEKRNDRNAPFHPTPLTKNCKGCPGTNCKGCLGTGQWPRMQGRPPHFPASTVIRLRRSGFIGSFSHIAVFSPNQNYVRELPYFETFTCSSTQRSSATSSSSRLEYGPG